MSCAMTLALLFVNGAINSVSWLANGELTGQTWQEIGESDGPIIGDIALAQFLGGIYEGVRFQGQRKGTPDNGQSK